MQLLSRNLQDIEMAFSHRDLLVILSVALSTFLGMVAMSGINIALPMIVKEFNTTLVQASWIMNAYLLVMAGLIVIMGRIADTRGLKRTFLEGVLIFNGASLLCFFSWDLNALIGSRIVQAIGASMFIASGPALIATQVSRENQGKGQSVITAISPIGAALGVGLGGVITGCVGWRAVFLLSIPLGILVYLIGVKILSEIIPNKNRTPFDIRGSVLLFLTLVTVLTGCTLIYIPSSGNSCLIFFGLSLLCGISFFSHQKRTQGSVLNISLLKNRSFFTALASSVLLYSLYSGLNFFMPLILTYSFHLPSGETGFWLMLISLGSGLCSLPAGKIADQYGSRVICIGACCIIIPVFVSFIIVPYITTLIIVLFFLFRAAFMLYASPSTKQILDQCPEDQIGSGSGIMQTSRYAAYAIGIAVLSIVFETAVYRAGLTNDGTAILPRLTPALERLGYVSIFITCLIIAIFALLFCVLTRDRDHQHIPPKNETRVDNEGMINGVY